MNDRNVFIDTSAFIAMRVSDDGHFKQYGKFNILP